MDYSQTGGSSVDNKIQCDFPGCSGTFTRTQESRRHREEYHEDPKLCPWCDYTAKRKKRLFDHMDEKHRPKKSKPPSGESINSQIIVTKANVSIVCTCSAPTADLEAESFQTGDVFQPRTSQSPANQGPALTGAQGPLLGSRQLKRSTSEQANFENQSRPQILSSNLRQIRPRLESYSGGSDLNDFQTSEIKMINTSKNPSERVMRRISKDTLGQPNHIRPKPFPSTSYPYRPRNEGSNPQPRQQGPDLTFQGSQCFPNSARKVEPQSTPPSDSNQYYNQMGISAPSMAVSPGMLLPLSSSQVSNSYSTSMPFSASASAFNDSLKTIATSFYLPAATQPQPEPPFFTPAYNPSLGFYTTDDITRMRGL